MPDRTLAHALELDGSSLTLEQLRRFEAAAPGGPARGVGARDRMEQSAAAVAATVDSGRVAYGINTGFGAFANRVIPADKTRKLQLNLVRSHACGVGDPLPGADRAAHAAAQGQRARGGILRRAPARRRRAVALLNADVLPVIPAQGSVGASGDLAPLAHMALALIGEGEATAAGDGATRALPAPRCMQAAGVEPLELQAKEGLALLNGTQLSLALALEGLFRAERLLDAAVVCCAMTVEGLAGSHAPFDDRVQQVSRLPGQVAAARKIRAPARLRQRDSPQPRELRARAGPVRRALHAAGLRRGRAHARARARRARRTPSTASPTTR